MHIGEISFCDKVCYNIKSNDYKKQILEELEEKYCFKIIKKHFETYNNSFLDSLKSKPHMISIRSNGNPYILYLTKYNFVNQCIFIDKKIQNGYFYPRMILSKINFEDSLFEGTLLEGEMIKNNNTWVFAINDIFSHKSKKTENIDLVERINDISYILENNYFPDKMDCCDIILKKYFKYSEYSSIPEFINRLPYTSRGLYFKPLNNSRKDILLNFNDSLVKRDLKKKISDGIFSLKEKPEDEKHIEKHIVKTNSPVVIHNNILNNLENNSTTNEKVLYGKKTEDIDVYELYESLEACSLHSIACVMKMETSKFLRNVFKDTPITQRVKLLCEFNAKQKKWKPFQIM
jgi:hypothetical protein